MKTYENDHLALSFRLWPHENHFDEISFGHSHCGGKNFIHVVVMAQQFCAIFSEKMLEQSHSC